MTNMSGMRGHGHTDALTKWVNSQTSWLNDKFSYRKTSIPSSISHSIAPLSLHFLFCSPLPSTPSSPALFNLSVMCSLCQVFS